MSTETFQLDYRRAPFAVIGVSVVVWILFSAADAGPWALLVGLPPLLIGIAVAWYFGVIQVSANGVVLYRTHTASWTEITDVSSTWVLGLPYLRIKRVSGFSWLLPLYTRGDRSLLESLAANAARGTSAATKLRALCESGSPSPSNAA